MTFSLAAVLGQIRWQYSSFLEPGFVSHIPCKLNYYQKAPTGGFVRKGLSRAKVLMCPHHFESARADQPALPFLVPIPILLILSVNPGLGLGISDSVYSSACLFSVNKLELIWLLYK